jgi:hypothetical protein
MSEPPLVGSCARHQVLNRIPATGYGLRHLASNESVTRSPAESFVCESEAADELPRVGS